MKTKQILFLMTALLLMFGAVGCDKDESVQVDLIGSWKLKGLGDTDKNSFIELEPKDCEKCYTLFFENNGSFSGQTSINLITGKFSINKNEKTIKIVIGTSTYAAESKDGDLYNKCLSKATRYSYNKKGLKLFYEDNKYLLYKKLE